MNLRKYLERRPVGRFFHRWLVTVLLVCVGDMNPQTVLGVPAQWIVALHDDPGMTIAIPTAVRSASQFTSIDPVVGWGLGMVGGPWNRGFPYRALDAQAVLRLDGSRVLLLAQGGVPPQVAQPVSPACMVLEARTKTGKVQLVWNPVPGTLTYELYRGSDSEPVRFLRIGDVAGNATTFLDAPIANEQTYLYFIRAVGPGLACDSEVAGAHPTALRGTQNHPPVIYSQPPSGATAGESVNYLIRAADPNAGDILRYGLVQGPPGMEVHPDRGELQWTAEAGTYEVIVEANDGRGGADFQTFSLMIAAANVSVPDVVGLALADAETAITDAGLVVGDVALAHDDAVPEGQVISQDPAAGTPVAPGSAVDLVVSQGPTPVTVPDVVGLTQAAAEAAITAAGLTVGAVTTANHPTVPAGSVISQNPVAGTGVAPGTTVALVVSLGPTSVTVPDVVGLTQAAAEAAVIAAGLSVGPVTTANDPNVPAGSVISQDPTAGSSVPPGTAVALVVSLGPTPVEVPDVVGLPQADAETAITDAGLVVGDVTLAHDDTVPEGQVISQDPAAGTSVAPGSAVDLVVSQGPTPVTVPDVVGLTQAAAEAAITAAGLAVGAVTTANHPTVPAGSVISQSPVAGTSVAPGTTVALVVSLGPTSVTVPDVVGLTQAAAEAAIIGAGLAVGAVTTANDPNVPAGSVISQDPAAGSSVPPGTAVALVVSLGPTPVEVPDVVGLPQADAETAITDAGLVVGDVTLAHDDTVPEGQVISQDPAAGTSVAPGSAVDLVVSQGPTPVTVPDVVGLTQAAAEAAITAAGLAVGAVTTANHPTVPAGSVISQSPVAGTSVAPGTTVALVVSLGPTSVTVPDVVGLTQAAAEAAVIAAGLSVGPVTTANDPNVPAGSVISQDPTAGSSVPPGTAVALVISSGSGVPVLVSIAVTPTDQTLVAGETLQLTATGTLSDGGTRDLTATALWESTDLRIANVTASGLATALDPGTTAIRASQEGVVGSTSLTVDAPALSQLVITPSDSSLLVGDSQAFAATGVLTDGTSTDLTALVTWSSSETGVATIDASGVATAAGPGDTVIEASRNGISASASMNVQSRITEDVAPTAVITAPANNSVLTTQVEVIGTADDANFLKYILDFAPAGSSAFTVLAEGTAPVIGGTLGSFNPAVLINDLYTVRLRVFDRAGNIAIAAVTYQVALDLKTGLFTLAFEDLRVPVAGLPIILNRIYDSRDKGVGDFGFGWRLDIQTTKATANRVQGTAWRVDRSGGFFPTYTLVAADQHKVSIKLPDGKVEEFDLTPTPSSSVLFPLQFITAAYTARPGTYGRLEPLGGTGLYVSGSQPGVVELLDDGFFEIYNPTVFRYTAVDGRVFVISTTSGVQSITDPNGISLTLGPGGISHSSGASVSFQRDAQGRITRITDPNGNFQTYSYNANGDLIAHTDPAGETTRFSYNLSHGLLEVRDPRGVRAVRSEYDDQGRLVATIDPNGNRLEYTHDTANNRQTFRDARGNITVEEYDATGKVLARIDALGGRSTFTYDAAGNQLTRTDPLGHTTSSSYDAGGRMTSETDPLGHTATFAYNERGQITQLVSRNGHTTVSTFDSKGNLTRVVDPLGHAVTNAFDNRGNRTATTDRAGNSLSFQYNAGGRITRYVDTAGRITTYAYDANGNNLAETNTRTASDGSVVTFTTSRTFDSRNRLVSETDPLGATSSVEYGPLGKETARVDKNGHRTSFEYDGLGRLTATVFPDGTREIVAYDADGNRTNRTDQAGHVTRFEYDALNRLVRTIHPDDATAASEYDAAGQEIASTDPLGHRTEHAYDTAGRRIRTTDPEGNVTSFEYDAQGNRTRVIDPDGDAVTYEYDAVGRKIRTTFPDGTTSAATYDGEGRLTSMTDQAGNTTSYQYDGAGKVTRVVNALGGETRYAYDEVGNLVAQTDANGNTTTWAYDSLGRPTRRTLPLGMSEQFAYDPNGNLVSHTKFDGNIVQFAYDSMNRLVRRTYPDGTAVEFTYSSAGQLESESDARGTTTFEYDARNRVTRVLHPDGRSIDYTYDLAGNRTSLTTPEGTTHYTYDTLNRLAAVEDPRGQVTSYTYIAGSCCCPGATSSHRASLTYPNGTSAHYSYDALNRLIRLENRRPDGSILSSYDYTLGPAGNRIRVVEESGRATDYSYDALYRLTEESISDPAAGNRNIAYAYDAVANRLSRTEDGTVTDYTYDVNDRMLSEGADAFDYDANGNLVRRLVAGVATAYSYDFDNRLATAAGPGTDLEFQYDAAGNRVEGRSGTTAIRYLVDRNRQHAQVLAEYDDTGAAIVSYVYGDDLISQHRGAAPAYHHYDGLGSTRALSGADGGVTDTYAYDAFGRLLGSTGASVNHYLFTGAQLDPNLGFYYLRARYYMPQVGRFLTMDPFMGSQFDPPSLHKYAYAHNDPVNKTDPSGLFVGAMSFPSISISIPAFSGAALLALLTKIVILVTAAAVAACALSAAISGVTAIASGNPCDITHFNIFYSGFDTPETTAHIAAAIFPGGRARILHRISPNHSRGWLRSDPRCNPAARAAFGSSAVCDEYPFASTAEGGQANNPSLQLTAAWEGSVQGGKISAFYGICQVRANDPVDGIFGVVPVGGISRWVCK